MRGVTAAASHRLALFACAAIGYAAVMFAFVAFEASGLGIGHFYYVPIALVALATDAFVGAGAGLAATLLYVAAIYLTPRVPTREVLTLATMIRAVTYSGVGALIGWFAHANRDLIERLREQAARDHMTGLANARDFDDALARRCAEGRPFALILADMDDLKRVNDTLGHVAGNEAITEMAEILRRIAPPGASLARIGGDDFALLVDGGRDEALAVCAAVAQVPAEVELSFGWCLFPDDATEAAELFDKADDRLYAAKLLGRNRKTVQSLAVAP